MRKAVLHIATSLDGLIAGDDGDLSRPPQPNGDDDCGYAEFIAGVSTVVTGGATYDFVVRNPLYH